MKSQVMASKSQQNLSSWKSEKRNLNKSQQGSLDRSAPHLSWSQEKKEARRCGPIHHAFLRFSDSLLKTFHNLFTSRVGNPGELIIQIIHSQIPVCIKRDIER